MLSYLLQENTSTNHLQSRFSRCCADPQALYDDIKDNQDKGDQINLAPHQGKSKKTNNYLRQAMHMSLNSQREIQSWDKKMSLKRSHSATMTKTPHSRKQLIGMCGYNVVSRGREKKLNHLVQIKRIVIPMRLAHIFQL